MGLDMYLHKKIYVGANWEHNKVTGTVDIKRDGKPLNINFNKITEIEESAGYWRKANHIHNWFVENVQDGHDDCKEYWVSKEKMQELLELVNKVLEASELVEGDIQNGTRYTKEKGEEPIIEKGKYIKDSSVAEELLPTTEGFFFGGTSYDQYYYQDLEETKKILEEALKDDGGDYYYQASW